jgi:hypothetical protein
MDSSSMVNVGALLAEEHRWRTALVGGLAGGVAGAVGELAPTGGLFERLLLTAVVALALALVLVVLVSWYDRR